MKYIPFLETYNKWADFDFNRYIGNISENDVKKSLAKEKPGSLDFINLLSGSAEPFIEEMARKASMLTIRNFGKTISLYIPLYLSNYCVNECAYCGFNRSNNFPRLKLSMEEVEKNAREISMTGMKHLLILTGESKTESPVSYIEEALVRLRGFFASVSIEVYPMDIPDYQRLFNAGADGLTIYQETYDRKIYDMVHLSGPKKNFEYRLGAPERSAIANFRSVSIGPLYGLGDPLREAFFCGLHAEYIFENFPGTEVGLSLPRLNEAEGDFKAISPLTDKKFVQFLAAFRLFLPRAGIALSTRERPAFRDNLIGLGITKMSGGSSTSVGGYCGKPSTPQFEVSDHRSVEEIAGVISEKGYDPVYKDWEI
ncbi:MAG: 2-iminoacetate synthase ThiH [Brevinematales bacterium]|jgi:2-iminoacetate synthase